MPLHALSTHIRTPSHGRVYSVNLGNSTQWDDSTAAFVAKLSATKSKSLRYIGTMIADVHRTLLYGGIFMYPAQRGMPHGKLSLVFEAAPMAFLARQAGATAIAGPGAAGCLLRQVPQSTQQRTPVVIGSRDDVAEYMREVSGRKQP